MKTLLLVLLFLSIKANAQISPLSDTLTTTSTTSTSATPTSTLSTTSSSSTSTSATPSHTTTSASTTPSSTSTSAVTTTTSSAAVPSPVVTSINGVVTTVVTVVGPSSSTSSSQPTSSSTAPPSDTSGGGGGGLGTGSIIGLSVAGGVAVIGIIAFFIWKLTRKRFTDFDDGEAIKWPDLNTHPASDSHPLPVHNTGRAGFDTGSENSLSRVNLSNDSTTDFASSDPYAVPPLPHLNPNQPYRDDPGAGAAYYDPYRGPIPGTIEQSAAQDWAGESFPMTQMNPGGRMSPGPSTAYSGDGRRSPGPQTAYGRTVSPAPQAAYAGRTSPGPQAAYGASTTPVPPPGYDAYSAK